MKYMIKIKFTGFFFLFFNMTTSKFKIISVTYIMFSLDSAGTDELASALDSG